MAVQGSRVAVSTSAVALNTAGDSDSRYGSTIIVQADVAGDVDLGGSDVAAGAGFLLGAGDVFSIELGPGDVLYAVAASATSVHVLQVGA